MTSDSFGRGRRLSMIDRSHSRHFASALAPDDPSDIGGDDQKILVVFLLEILQKDGRSINIVDRDIEKALNLIGMDIHDQDAVDADALEDIGDNA